MNWYYAQGSEQKGPVTEAELAQLAADGTVTANTLVWREGMEQWTPWSVIQASQAGAPPASLPGAGTCSVCRQPFAPDDLVHLGGRSVCAACKPVLIQQLRQGSATLGSSGTPADPSNAAHGSLTPDDIIARDYDVPVTAMFGDAWQRLFAEPGTLLVAGALITFILFASGIVPYLGAIAGFILHGPLYGGLLLLFLRRIRGGTVTVSDAFCGFGPRFWKMSWAYIAPLLLTSLVFIPIVILITVLAVGTGMAVGAAGAGGIAVSFIVLAIMLGLASVLIAMYFSIGWFWTLCLVADRRLPVGEAMKLSRKVVGRHFWLHVWLLMFSGIVGFIGFLACGIGIFVATPLIALTSALVYERIFYGLASRE